MPSNVSVGFVSPRLFDLTNMPTDACIPDDKGRVFLPPTLTLSSQYIESDNIYLLDNSRFLYLFVGQNVDDQKFQDVFGVPRGELSQKTFTMNNTQDPNSPRSRIHVLIDNLRSCKPNYHNIQVILSTGAAAGGFTQAESLDESNFYSLLIEDGTSRTRDARGKKVQGSLQSKEPNSMSYIDFLCWVHKRIQNKFY